MYISVKRTTCPFGWVGIGGKCYTATADKMASNGCKKLHPDAVLAEWKTKEDFMSLQWMLEEVFFRTRTCKWKIGLKKTGEDHKWIEMNKKPATGSVTWLPGQPILKGSKPKDCVLLDREKNYGIRSIVCQSEQNLLCMMDEPCSYSKLKHNLSIFT